MTDAQIIEKTAQILFTCDENGEIDAWKVYDKLEALFAVHRLEIKQKYESSIIQQIIKETININPLVVESETVNSPNKIAKLTEELKKSQIII